MHSAKISKEWGFLFREEEKALFLRKAKGNELTKGSIAHKMHIHSVSTLCICIMLPGRRESVGRLYKSACYCTNLRRSAVAVSNYYSNALKEVGLNASQYYLLINLSRLRQANITQWANHVGLERSTMVRNIRVLQERGWIAQTHLGHGKQFALTDAGEVVLKEAIPIWEQTQAEMERFLGQADAEAVLRVGEKLQGLEG